MTRIHTRAPSLSAQGHRANWRRTHAFRPTEKKEGQWVQTRDGFVRLG